MEKFWILVAIWWYLEINVNFFRYDNIIINFERYILKYLWKYLWNDVWDYLQNIPGVGDRERRVGEGIDESRLYKGL